MRPSAVREDGAVVTCNCKVLAHDRQVELKHFAQFEHHPCSMRQPSQTNAERGPELLRLLSCVDLLSRVMHGLRIRSYVSRQIDQGLKSLRSAGKFARVGSVHVHNLVPQHRVSIGIDLGCPTVTVESAQQP